MGLTGFNRDRKKRLADKVGEELADELFGMGITDAEKLTRLDEVFGVLGTSEEKAKEIKKKVKDALNDEESSGKEASKGEEDQQTEQEEAESDEAEEEDQENDKQPQNTDEDGSESEYPKRTGGSWYELSNGEKVQGKDEAVEAQQELDEG